MGSQAIAETERIQINFRNTPTIPDNRLGLKHVCHHNGSRGMITFDPQFIRFSLVERSGLDIDQERKIGATANLLNLFLRRPRLIPSGMTGNILFTGTSFFNKERIEVYCFLFKNSEGEWECGVRPVRVFKKDDMVLAIIT
jgi:hypothetical protein